MYCKNCGAALAESARFCVSCGQAAGEPAVSAGVYGGRIGFSGKINDPAFAKYLKNTNRWSAIFSIILAVVAVVGFTIAGEMGIDDMQNPEALYIGLGVGAMFLIIAVFTIISRKNSRTWDGVVVDKTVKRKNRRQSTGDDDYYIHYYTEYAVVIRQDNGKTHRLAVEDDDTIFNYYQTGDRVRHHAGLNSYEKYDKSCDSIIFCNACGTLCSISDDVCFRCKCPLLK